MRKLWYVPTLHTVHETITPQSKIAVRSLPSDIRHDHADIMRTWWLVRRALERRIASGAIDPHRLHVFCDGVPVRPGSLYRARMKTSPTLRAILWLKSLGARLRGTESMSFLMVQGMQVIGHPVAKRVDEAFGGLDVMTARDLFVAERMIRVVPANHDALCFMGARHRVDVLVRRHEPSIPIEVISHFARLADELRRH